MPKSVKNRTNGLLQEKSRNIPDMNSSFEQEQRGNAFEPSYNDIQVRAYLLHEQRGGNPEENWFEAERALREEYNNKSFKEYNNLV